MPLPDKIYKYQKFDTLSISNLKNQQIYFSDPAVFNDPYDCALEFDSEKLDENQYKVLMKEYLEEIFDIEILERIRVEYGEHYELDEEFINAVDTGISSALDKIKNKLFRNKGVACFSAKPDDILMWAYYANGHKGFCLEFDTSTEPFNKAYQVKYKDSIPQLKISKIIWGDNEEHRIEPLLTKYTSWEHEQEYRIIHNEKNLEYTYPAKSLTGIYFGPEIKKEHLEIIALILRGQNPDVQLYQGERRTDHFKIVFTPVDYTPFVERNDKPGG